MAITWDSTPATRSDGWAFRVGYEASQSPTTLTSSTSSVTVTIKLYVQTRYAVTDSSNTFSWSGDAGSGSTAVSIATKDTSGWADANIILAKTISRTFTPAYGANTTTSFSVSLTGIDVIPGTSSVSGTFTTGPRPYSAPAAPTGVTSTRVSDTSQTVSWTRTSPDSVSAPYQNVVIQRWVDTTNTYATIATVGNVSSYTDNGTVAGRRYRYRVSAKNSGGQSAWAYSDYLYTTPSAPTNVQATKSGADIVVSWTASPSPITNYRLAYEDGTGGVQYPGWTTTGTSYTVTAPDPALTHRYLVAAQAGDAPLLLSDYVSSNTVQLQAPPSAPTNLKPTLAASDAAVTLSWTHNSVDTTPQSAYELQWRVKGTTTWTGTGKVTSTTSSRVLSQGTWTANNYEWQVRTWGSHATASPWSGIAITTVSDRPSVTLDSPTAGTVNASRVTASWTYYDPDGSAQQQARVTLLSSTGATLWVGNVVGTGSSLPVAYTLADKTSYTIRVEVQDAVGLWSPADSVDVSVAYLPPPIATFTVEPVQETGAAVLAITVPAPGTNEVDAVSCEVWRSVDGGPWLRIAAGLPLDTSVLDPIPSTSGQTAYKVVTVSSLPSTAETAATYLVVEPRGWVYLNTGPGFTDVVRMRDNAKLTPSWKRETALHHFAGRARPTAVRSEQQTRQVGVSVRLAPNPDGGATYAELEEFLANASETILYRDPKGRRWFCDVPELSGSEERIKEEASFTVTEIDYDEAGV